MLQASTLKPRWDLLSLPRDIEPHPESGDMIQAGLGRFGPYLKYQGKFTSLSPDDDVLEIGINRAVDLLAEAAKKAGRFTWHASIWWRSTCQKRSVWTLCRT